MKQHTYGYLYALLASFLYALVAIISKHLILGGTHPFQITFYQYVFTVLILAAWILIRNPSSLRHGARQIRSFALLGVGGACTNLCLYSSLQHLDAGVGSMLLFLHPIFITVFFAVTRLKPIRWINYFCVLIAVCGAAIVLDVFSDTLSFSAVGVAFGVLSAVAYAFYNIFADLKLKAEEPNVINFYACTMALFFTMGVLLINGVGFSVEPAALPPIFFLAAFAGVIPAYCFFKALQYIGSEKVSVVSSAELPLTLIMAFTVLKEHMKPFQLFGVLLIVAATVLLHRSEGAGEKEEIDAD